ncbi:MAG: LuxR family transcriptional regulator [Anaerolineae bacterium]|nr:LuxR family transcriptional regulator [Anaerolineae bacterium]
MDTPLLRTKLHTPAVGPMLISRPRLVARLNEGLYRKLSLISAPAGYGKTTLLAEWLAGMPRPHVWLTLDASDNDPALFLAYLLTALQGVDASLGRSAQAMLGAPTPPPAQVVLTGLINDLARLADPYLLVLDDYHLIHTLAIHEMLRFLLEHQPAQMHLVIASREDPPLPLARLRARGQMTELRQADLRFTHEEAGAFLRHVARLDLAPEQVALLHERTEGWIAALHLAGLQLLAISNREPDRLAQIVQSFTGSSRYVLDYLLDEVFGSQPPEVQGFLLQTAILERLNGDLCDAVTGRQDGRQMLAALEHANLPLVPLDADREWYRYHHLFADLLRHRLELDEHQHDLPDLHRRAGRWYESEGYLSEAVGHAVAARDWDWLSELIPTVSGHLFAAGQVITVLRWMAAIPEEIMRRYPRLGLERAWALILTEQIDAAEPYLDLAEEAGRAAQDGVLAGGVAVARVHVARARGDNRLAMQLSERALALLPEEEHASRSIVAVNLGIAQWFAGRISEAEKALLLAERSGERSGNHYARFAASVFLNRIRAARGALRQAAAGCRRLIALGGQVSILALAHYDLGRLLYEGNELKEAEAQIGQGLALAQAGGSAEFRLGAISALALIQEARGNADGARASLHEGDELCRSADCSPATQLYHLTAEIRVALEQGDLALAALAAQRIPAPEESGSFPDWLEAGLVRTRLLLAQGQPELALALLDQVRGMAARSGWQSVALRARILQAAAVADQDEALNILSEVLAAAAPEGCVRSFLDGGEPMASLLSQAVARGVSPAYARGLLKAFEATRAPLGVEGSPASQPPPQPLIEPLSERELEVLRLLAASLTNDEIARQLYLSVNTVKTHLKNVYAKLGVHSRRQAVAEARALHLID